jgi:hypothetical protein
MRGRRASKAEAPTVVRCRGDQMLGWNWLAQVAVRLAMDHRSYAMPTPISNMSLVLTLLAIPIAGCQSAAGGATGGAVAGAVVGGPVGAVVGGVAGGMLGAALSPEESTRVRQHVVAQPTPSARVAQQVVVGQPVPTRVRLYPVPASVGLRTTYSYTVVNNQTVLVDPQSRRIVQVLD